MKKQTTTSGPTGFSWVRSLLAFRHQSPSARLVSTLLALTTAALLAIVGLGTPAVAASPCPIPGNFEIDGDMTLHTCTPAADDWNTPGLDVTQTTQGGTYSTAGKDGGDTSTWVSSGSTPDKTNFERAYAAARNVDVGGGVLHYFVYVGWDRTDTAGTQGYAIEINGTAPHTALDGTPQPDRSHGTAVVYVSSQGSSAPTFDSACTFTTQADYGDTCTTTANANVTIAINTSSITDPLNNNTTQVAGSFFEVAIDVTGLTGITPSCPGADANSVYLRSVTGQTKNGNLKGYMAPLEVAPESTCVKPTITTQTQQNDPIDGLDVVAPGTPQYDVATVTGTGAHLAPTGSVAFSLCGPTSSAADCTTGGQSGGSHALVQHASNSTAQSSPLSPTTPGWYCWRAEFTPDPVNSGNPFLPATATTKTNECFEVAHAEPTLTTASSAVTDAGAAAKSVGFTTLGDVATLSGVYPGADLSAQTVSFSLYGPLASTPGANDCVVGKRVAGPVDVALVAGVDNTTWTATAPTYKPTTANGPGYYTWVASYAGDSINANVDGKATSSCGEDNTNETQLLVGPVLTLTKGTPHSIITAGDPVVYDLNIKNVGDGTAKNVVVTDTLLVLASGHTWSLNATSGYNCQIAGAGTVADPQVVTCDIGNLNPLPTLTQIAEVTATTTPADCGDINNSAELTADPNVDQTVGPRTVTVQCPGLGITKTADAASVNVGNPIGFTVTVTNSGQGTATGVDLSDPLPTGPGITWTIDTDPLKTHGPLSCSITSGTLHCTGSLDAGGTQVVHVTSPTQWTDDGETQVNSCLGGTEGSGVYDNTAQVSASNVTATPNASAHEAVLCPDLHITKSADDTSVDAGSQIGFTITASNTGDAPATGAFVNDPLPTGVAWTIASQSGPLTCVISAGKLTCSADDPNVVLAAGQSQVVHITAPTAYADCGVYNNTATFTATDSPQAPNDSDSTTVQCPNLALVKTADAASVSAGGQIGFTVTATNKSGEGVGTATAVTINDPLPAGPGVDWSIASGPENCSIQGAPPSETLVCSAVDLAPGASESVHLVSATTTASCQAYANTATLAARNGPAAPITASATTAVANCVIVSPPEQQHPNVLPNTGGPDRWAFPAGLALLLAGTALVLGDRRRRHRS